MKERSTNYIDFDSPVIDCDKYKCNIEFALEEDIVNLGSWILINHPNFFDGSWKAALRYTFYLVNTVSILCIQFIFLMYFNIVAINDISSIYNRLFSIQEKGFIETFSEWF